MRRLILWFSAALSAVLLASCTVYKKVPEAQNRAVCQPVPGQGSPARCLITRDDAVVLPEEHYGKWTLVMATLSSPPGTKITKVVFRRDLCAPQGCVRTVSCLYGCGKRYFPNDGIDYSQAEKGLVQWWGRTDSDAAEGWLFDVHYQ
jgi:hypothetical protein